MEVKAPAAACNPFAPPAIHSPDLTAVGSRSLAWFSAAAVVTWIACGLWPVASMLTGRLSGVPAAVCAAGLLVYGGALIAILRLPRREASRSAAILLATVESLMAITVTVTTAWYLGGTGVGIGLLAVVAAQLPYFFKSPQIWTWVTVQTVAMMWLVDRADNATLVETFVFTLVAIGFQVFAAASSILTISEGRARSNLARANAELTATRELLAENSRSAERLRISRDLHDTLGHHLTALSLQLDVASRLSEGKPAEHVQQAHAITKLLLSDVREVVSSLRESGKLNLSEAIRALAIQPIDAQVHLDIPDMLIVEDAACAEALLRAVQEVLTNTSRHAHARNLWIRLAAARHAVVLESRDDGRGADVVTLGNGLTGMRERFESQGGRVDIRSSESSGFEVHAYLPLAASA